MNIRFFSIVGLIVLVGLFRLMPHPPNFTPVLAMALFAGAYITDRRLAFLVPLLAMVLSDLVLGFHKSLAFVYLGIAACVMLGWLLEHNKKAGRIFGVSVLASIVFFLISNLGAWLTLPQFYSRSLDGLLASYVAAIPFYQNSLLATLIFVVFLFGAMYLLERLGQISVRQ